MASKYTRQRKSQLFEMPVMLERDFKLLKLPKLWNSPKLDNEGKTFNFTIRYYELGSRTKFKFFLDEVTSYMEVYNSLVPRDATGFRKEIIRNIEEELEVSQEYIKNLVSTLSKRNERNLE